MPLTVLCPSCSARISAPDRLGGKTVKCPKCQTAMVLPSADLGFEVVEDDEPVVARVRAKPPADPGFTVVEDGEDDLPLPRRHPPAAADTNRIRTYIIIGGLVILAALTGILYYVVGKVSSIPTATTGATPPVSSNDWKSFTPPGERFTASLPGTPTFQSISVDAGLPWAKMQVWELNDADLEYKILIVNLNPGPANGPTVEDTLDIILDQFTAPANREIGVKETEATLGQHPARQMAYVVGIEHTILRAAVVGNTVFLFEVVRKNQPVAVEEEGVKKFFDTIAIQ